MSLLAFSALTQRSDGIRKKQAEDVVASLKADIAMRSIVVRDGQEVDMLARELVPGDVVS